MLIVTELVADPVPLLQSIVNVVAPDREPVKKLPERFLLPDQLFVPFEALHEVAFVEVQDTVLDPFKTTILGFAVMVTVGVGAWT